MNDITIFENPEFGTVRTLTIDEEPWFVGKDVAEILGYSNTRDALAKHVDDEDKRDGVAIHDAIGAVPGVRQKRPHEYKDTANDGEIHTKVHTYWTQKGRLFIYDLLKSDGGSPAHRKIGRTAVKTLPSASKGW